MITPQMVEHLNLKLEKEGSCLRYIESMLDGKIMFYEVAVRDKYIPVEYGRMTNVSNEFETMVRDFFKAYGITYTGFSNTVKTIYVKLEEE